jgi:hypothetical protein
MTTETDVINLALQAIGTQTTVTSRSEQSNEAVQANLVMDKLRDDLLRMAPWDCGFNFANLVYITSTPGTPENTSAGTTLWQKGQPAPPWAYEYQYPVNCLRACWVVPASQASVTGTPIFPVNTGVNPGFWQGPAVKFKIGIDQFYPVTAATVAAGGTGHAVGDIITLASGAAGSAPIGAPVQLLVLTAPAGVIGTVSVVNQINGASPAQGGSYFAAQTNPVAQGSTTGSGINATFNLTFGAKGDQRVILTNQEYATLAHVKQITDPNVMDPLFLDSWALLLGSRLAISLTGDKTLANMAVSQANQKIELARVTDGNEGLTVNDSTPDWIRGRGVVYDNWGASPNQFDWGSLWPVY